jgi:hypothetical protein
VLTLFWLDRLGACNPWAQTIRQKKLEMAHPSFAASKMVRKIPLYLWTNQTPLSFSVLLEFS